MPCKDRKMPEWITKFKNSKEVVQDQDMEDDQKKYCLQETVQWSIQDTM